MKRAANPLCHNRTDKPHKYPLPALPPNHHARQTLRPRPPQNHPGPVSDVVEVVRFLDAILRQPADWTVWLGELLAVPAGGTDLLPPEVRTALRGPSPSTRPARRKAQVPAEHPAALPNAVELSPSPAGRGVGVRAKAPNVSGKLVVSTGVLTLTLPSPKGRGFLISTVLAALPGDGTF